MLNPLHFQPAISLCYWLRRLVAGLLLAGWISDGQGAQPGFPLISTYTAIEVGAPVGAWSATQDADGILYFGSYSLLTFDGERWRSFSMNGAFGIRGLDFDDKGRLWAAAVGEIGYFERNDDAWEYVSLMPKLPAAHAALGELWHVFATKQGAVFVSHNRILRWDGKSFEIWKMDTERHLRAMRVDDRIFVQELNTGLYELTAKGPELLVPVGDLRDNGIFGLQSGPEGVTLAARYGLLTLQDGRVETIPGTATDFIRTHAYTGGVTLPDGRIAMGTMADGLAIVDTSGQLVQRFTAKDGLSAGYVTPLARDRDNGLWASSPAALYRIGLRDSSTLFDARAGLPTLPVRKIVVQDGVAWVANNEGLFRSAENRNEFTRASTGVLSLWDIVPAGDSFLAGGYRGIFKFNGGEARTVYSTYYDVFHLSPSIRFPNSWYFSDAETVGVLEANGRSRIILTNLEETATSIAEPSDGTLWLGTKGRGIFVAQPTATSVAAEPLPVALGVPNPRGEGRVIAGSDGRLLVFNANGGWFRPAGGREFTAIAGARAQTVPAAMFVPGTNDELWLVYENDGVNRTAVARVDISGPTARSVAHWVEGLERIGVPRSLFVEVTAAGETVLWIGGSNAIVRSVVTDGPSAPAPAAPVLRAAVMLNDHAVAQPIESTMPFSVKSLRFEFASPEFSRRAALRFETRIDGIDTTWQPAAASRRELTAIRDGNYVLRARVVAETGVPSAETALRFRILPPWWRTKTTLAGTALVIGLLGLGAYRLRIRALRARNAELEKRVRQRTEELEKANAAKTQFVANMSHDIRNPLNGIVGLALALEDTRLDPRQREVVATLRECTTYLSTLVDDVLDFASIEAGRVELRPRSFGPPDLLRSVVEALKGDTAASGAWLTIEAAPDVPAHIIGDDGRIQQVLVNFVSNALKYAGGHIRLTATLPAASPGEIEFAVRDAGEGISETEQVALFTKFSRLKHKHGRDPIPGTGLGLAACRLLADLMGGSVGVESRRGEGARFFLRLPLTVADAPEEVHTEMLPNTTVLLVEDTDYNAWAATAVLGRLGLTCERARSGAEALQLFAAKRFNIVLLDRNLPDMDGTEVARRMRELEGDALPSILLAVTAYCTAEDRRICLEAGMDAFVGKPLTPEKIRKALLGANESLPVSSSVSVVPSANPAAASFDLSLLQYLSDGTPGGLERQVDRFVEALDLAAADLEAALQGADGNVVADAAHRVLSHGRMIGAAALVTAAGDLEAAARAANHAESQSLARDVKREVRALTATMRRRPPVAPSK